jgi:hypothetical protein
MDGHLTYICIHVKVFLMVIIVEQYLLQKHHLCYKRMEAYQLHHHEFIQQFHTLS